MTTSIAPNEIRDADPEVIDAMYELLTDKASESEDRAGHVQAKLDRFMGV